MIAHDLPEQVEVEFFSEARALLLELRKDGREIFPRRLALRMAQQDQVTGDCPFMAGTVQHDNLIGLFAHDQTRSHAAVVEVFDQRAEVFFV